MMIYAMERTALDRLTEMQKLDGAAVAQLMAKLEARSEPAAPRGESGGIISVIPIYGAIEQRPSLFGMLFGGTSVSRITAALRQSMADPQTKAIALDISSPGGEVSGLSELAGEIMAAKASKPIVALVNRTAASAAYWIAAACSEVVGMTDSIQGSVGVIGAHVDTSEAEAKEGVKVEYIYAGEYKVDAAGNRPLSDAGRESMQAMVDHIYGIMLDDIARGRGITAEAVKADFGKGLVLTAPAAQAVGMIDRISTFDATMQRLSTPQGRAAVMRGEYVEPMVDDGEAERRLRMARVTV